MKVIVVTGSTRGIGFALAQAFLERGCAVTVSGRTAEAVEKALAALSPRAAEHLLGQPCDVTDYAQLQALWDAAQAHFGRVDIWINNAGISAGMADIWEHAPEAMRSVVETNLLGALYGSKVALQGMLAQGSGAVYNMEGAGSDGSYHRGMALYGTTKYGLHYANRALLKEIRAQGKPILVGAIRPGMVLTDMITGQIKDREDGTGKFKRIVNIIAERPETVAPVLAERILANQKNGATIAFSSPARLMLKFLKAPFSKRDLFNHESIH